MMLIFQHFHFSTYINKKETFRKVKNMKDYHFFDNKKDFPVAMAYVPWQNLENVYENLEEAFCAGTLFPELNKPFTGRRGKS